MVIYDTGFLFILKTFLAKGRRYFPIKASFSDLLMVK